MSGDGGDGTAARPNGDSAAADPPPPSPPPPASTHPAALASDLVGRYLSGDGGGGVSLDGLQPGGAGPQATGNSGGGGAHLAAHFQSVSSFGRLRSSSRLSVAAPSGPASPVLGAGDGGLASTLSSPTATAAASPLTPSVAAWSDNNNPRSVLAARTIQRAVRAHLAAAAAARRPFSKHGAQARDLVQRYVAVLQAAAVAGRVKGGSGGSGGGAAASATTTPDPTAPFLEGAFASRARLILHFDVNKTIVMADAVQGAGAGAMVNMLLSECAWGRLEAGPAWVPVGRLAADRPAGDPQLMTYRSFLDSFLLPTGGEGGSAGDGAEPPPAALAAAAAALGLPPPSPDGPLPSFKDARQALKRRFTDPGQPGAMFRSVYDRLVDALAPCSRPGVHQILPSFFNLLLHLRASKREFAIVLRSFGTDLGAVLAEIDAFARGEHPAYPGVRMDGSDGGPDMRAGAGGAGVGAFFRESARPEGTALLFGPGAAPFLSRRGGLSLAALEEAAAEAAKADDAAPGDGTRLLRGFGEIRSALQAATCAHCRAAAAAARGEVVETAVPADPTTSGPIPGASALPRPPPARPALLALRDYYPHWKARQERSRAGKLFLVEPGDPTAPGVGCIQVFFDDNIGYGTAHIVDARDARSGAALAFSDVAGSHVVRVEPLNAVLDPHYFVRAVHECVLGVMRKRQEAAAAAAAGAAGVAGGSGSAAPCGRATPAPPRPTWPPAAPPLQPASPARPPSAPPPAVRPTSPAASAGAGSGGGAADAPAPAPPPPPRPRPRVTLSSSLAAQAVL
jgi:hypothetical protein